MMEGRPKEILVWTDGWTPTTSAEVRVEERPGGALAVLVSSPDTPVTHVALRWPAAVPARALVLGDHWERGYGDMAWRGVVPERVLPWFALVHDPGSGRTRGVGVETGASALASWRVDEAGVTLLLDVQCGGSGVRLGGRTLEAATVRSAMSEDGETPFAFARRFCAMLCAEPRLPVQPVYGSNDWYHRYGAISAETVVEDAGLIADLSPDGVNRPYHVIDAGWYPAGATLAGPFDRGGEGFPDMAGLADRLRGMGVRPGIWIRPLFTSETVPASWRLGEGHPHAAAEFAMLDPSVPEVMERVREDVERLVAWGYELVKFDFTTFDLTGRWGFQMESGPTSAGWAFADRARTTAEVVRSLYETIRSAAGGACLMGCNTLGHLGAGLFEVQRTGDDTSGKFWERTRRMGVNALAFRMPQHGVFFACDADCVGLTAQAGWDLNAGWLELVSRSGTPLFVSVEPAILDHGRREAVRRALALAATPPAPAEPLDWLETTCPRRWRFADGDAAFEWATFPGAALPCPG